VALKRDARWAASATLAAVPGALIPVDGDGGGIGRDRVIELLRRPERRPAQIGVARRQVGRAAGG